MKKFYLVFFISFIALSVLLYISSWWFLAGVAVIVLITTYQFYQARLRACNSSVEELGLQIEELQRQLDRSLAKEAKAASEIAETRTLKKKLLTALSHEIRTPMNGVLSMSRLLKDTSLTKEQNEYIDTIKKSGESLISSIDEILVNDILEYSKIERKNRKTDTIDFDLRDSIEEVTAMFVTAAGKKGIELLIDIDNNVPLLLHADNWRLRDILMNLVENAIRYTQHGQVLVSARTLGKNGEESIIRLEVIDTGTGLNEEDISKLFYKQPARGFEGNNKTTRGLVVCSKLAKQMGGKIEVTSLPGKGSTFSFTAAYSPCKQQFVRTEQPRGIKSLEGKNILVVDDNRISRQIISQQLKSWKMIPVTIGSAEQALQILEENNRFELILVDHYMPYMDGIQFARAVKKSYPRQKIVLLHSAHNDSYKHDQELFAGITGKPLRHHAFRDNMIALVEDAGIEQEHDQNNNTSFASCYPLRILVAEDNMVNQKIAIKILGKLGYNVRIANNGKETIEILATDTYDIILMDVQMPEMDGIETTKLIRTQMPYQPVIIALTANVMQGDQDACIQAGMDDYLSKPIIPDDLKNKLSKWFATKKEIAFKPADIPK